MRRYAALLSAFALIGCTELPAIEEGRCGNAVIEPSAGEDCDTFAEMPGSLCLPPGAPRGCRYDCTQRDDGSRPPCPPGMGCGVDGTCRWPSGALAASQVSIAAAPRDLGVTEMDGDRRQELVISEHERSVVHYFGDRLEPSEVLVIPSSGLTLTLPLAAELSGDPLSDLVVPHEGGIVIALGSVERALLPTAFPSVVLPADVDQVHHVSLEVLPDVDGEEVLLLASTPDLPLASVMYVDKTLRIESVTLTLEASQLTGDVLVGNIVEDPVDSPCDELLLPFRDLEVVTVFSPCKRDPSKGIVLNTNGAPSVVQLASGDRLSGRVALQDLDHDGHLDLAAVASDGAGGFVQVAYGLGDGRFHSASPVVALADGKAARAASLGSVSPLAIGDLDGDGAVDYVDAGGVHLRRSVGWEEVGASAGASFGEAVIADLNANGHLDVLAAFAGVAGARFFNGTGAGQFSVWDIDADGQLSRLKVGDFDGDLVRDVAATESESSGRDFVSVLFGEPWSGPSSPQHMGLMEAVLQVSRGRANTSGPVTPEEDIVTLSRLADQRLTFAGFAGRTDRNLRSPFVTVQTVGSGDKVSFEPYAPLRLAAGQFDADGHADLAELGSSTLPAHRLWLAPVTGEARIRPSDARASDPLPGDIDYALSSFAAGDLDGDGIDELVVLAPSTSSPGSAALVAKSVDSGDGFRTWKLAEPVPLEQRFEHHGADGAPEGATARTLAIVELDADGGADVIALDRSGGLWIRHGDGTAAFAGFDTRVDAPGLAATSFAVIQADRDAPSELLLLVESRVYLVDRQTDGSFRVGTSPLAELPGATLIAAGDFDGDGVADVALGGAAAVAVFRGLPGLE